MKKIKYHKLVLYLRLTVLSVVFLATIGGGVSVIKPEKAVAAANATVNFQARLLTAAGSIVPDGNYNVEFKLYNAATSSGSSQGSCSGDSACVWTETRTSTDKVRTVNGYLTVNLGSVNAFSTTINWDQEHWLTMNIGGTGTPGWDGEMGPNRLKLTAVPYAFRAGTLVSQNGANINTVSFAAPTATRTITIPDESGTICLQSSGACGFLTSAAANSSYIQNQASISQTANFRISGTGRADTGLQTPLLDTASAVALAIGTTNATAINLQQNTTLASGKTLTIQGNTLIKPASDGVAFEVKTSTNNSVLAANTSNTRVGIGNASPSYALDVTNDINSTTALRVGGNIVCTSTGCTASTGSSSYIQNTTTVQTNANTAIQSAADGSITALLKSRASQTADLLQLQDSSTNVLASFTSAGNLSFGNTADKTIMITQASSGNNGNILTLQGGSGNGTNKNGGNLVLQGGNSTGSGTPGSVIIKPQTNTTAAFLVQNAAGSSTILAVDTTNSRVGVMNASPTYPLDVTGDINSSTALRVGGNSVCTSSGCVAGTGSGFYVHNQTTVQAANMYVQAASTGTVAAKLQAFNGGSGDIVDFLNGTGTTVGSVSSVGAVSLKPSTDSASAFQVQPSGSSTPVIDVDTSNSRVGIGTATPLATFHVAVNNTQVTAPIALLEQSGTGDATLEFRASGGASIYIGQDASNSGAFTVNSSTAAAPTGIAHVQSNTNTNDAGATNMITAYGSNVVSGHLLVVSASFGVGSGGTMTCTDTQNNSWTTVVTRNDTANTQSFGVCYAISGSTSADSVTVTFNASAQFRRVTIHEYSGVATVSPVDGSIISAVTASTTSTDAITSGGVTTTVAGDLIFGAVNDTGGTTTITSGTGYTQRATVASDLNAEDKIQATAGSVSTTWTFTTAGHNYIAALVAFKPASSTLTDTFSNSLFNLSQTGAAIFRNSSNSTSAFQIQNTTSVNMFSVDTTNERVYVGPTAGDTVGALLVLGNKTNTGDPTGVEGAMYYNSASKTFRCYAGGAWHSCLGGLLSVNTAASSSINTCTTACVSFSTNAAIPANYCQAGRVIHVVANGTYSNVSATVASLAFGVYYGTDATTRGNDVVIGAASAAMTPVTTGMTNVGWGLDFYITCFSTTAMNGQGFASITTNTTAGSIDSAVARMYSSTNSTVTTTSNKNLYIFPSWGTSNGANTIVIQQLIVTAM